MPISEQDIPSAPTGGVAGVASVDGRTGTVGLSDLYVGAADLRLSDQRTPVDGSVTPAKLAATAVALFDAAGAAAGAQNASVAKAGDTMTGPLTLAANGLTAMQAVTLQQLQAAIDGLVNGAPGSLDTFIEAYNRFVADENIVTALQATVAGKVALATLTAANQVLIGTAAGTAGALDVPASTMVGRDASGGLAALTVLQVKTLLALAYADISGLGTAATHPATDFQLADPDLTAIAGLDGSTAGMIASDGVGGWLKKTYTQVKVALGLVKADVGLGNVDNTSDANKPVSTAQQTALDGKAGAELGGAQSNASFTTTSTTPVDLTGMSWTATIGAKPVLLVVSLELGWGLGTLTAGAFNTFTISVIDTTGGGSVEIAKSQPRMTVQQTVSFTRIWRIANLAAGARTFKLQVSQGTSTGVLNVNANALVGGSTAVMLEK